MIASLRALLTGLFDYAGLYPPATLSMAEALRNYRTYVVGADAWMLRAFVCGADRLGEMVAALGPGPPDELPLAVVAKGAGADEIVSSLDLATRRVREARERLGDRLTIEAVELPIPTPLLEQPGPLRGFLRQVNDRIEELDGADPLAFFEVPSKSRESVQWAVDAIAETQRWSADAFDAGRRGLNGLKVRAGGMAAAEFPSPSDLADLMVACREAGLFFKATAGLHQPFPHSDAQAGTMAHGFLALATAAILGWKHQLSATELATILATESGRELTFVDDHLEWRAWRAGIKDIAIGRSQSLVAIGSCSFDEPRAALAAIGFHHRTT